MVYFGYDPIIFREIQVFQGLRIYGPGFWYFYLMEVIWISGDYEGLFYKIKLK